MSGLPARPHNCYQLVCASPQWGIVADRWPPWEDLTLRDFGTTVTDHRSSWVRKIRLDGGVWYFKTYTYDNIGSRLANWGKWTAPWRRSRAARECAAYAWLTEHGFPAPSNFACLETRSAGFLRRATLVSAEVPGTPADQLLATSDAQARAGIARRIGDFVRALHQSGFRDRNLDLRNLIVGPEQIYNIDSPRYRIVRARRRPDSLARADWRRLLPQLDTHGVGAAAREAG